MSESNLNPPDPAPGKTLPESYVAKFPEIFAIEINGWCYGLVTSKEVFPALVHRVVKELGITFRTAVRCNYAFDILDVARKLCVASRKLISPREIAFSIMAQLPNPSDLDEKQQYTLAVIVHQIERQYGGALERLNRKWAHDPPRRRAGATPPPPVAHPPGGAADQPPPGATGTAPPKLSPESLAERFKMIFVIELGSWMYGLRNYPGEDFSALLERAVKELGITFREAVRFKLVYDVPHIARGFAVASSFVLPEEEVTAAICGQLQHPLALDAEQRKTLYEILRRAERAYPGGRIAARVAESWAEAEAQAAEARVQAAKDRAEMDALPDRLSGGTP